MQILRKKSELSSSMAASFPSQAAFNIFKLKLGGLLGLKGLGAHCIQVQDKPTVLPLNGNILPWEQTELFILRSSVMVICRFFWSKLLQIRTKYPCHTRNAYRTQRGRYQVNFQRENKP